MEDSYGLQGIEQANEDVKIYSTEHSTGSIGSSGKDESVFKNRYGGRVLPNGVETGGRQG